MRVLHILSSNRYSGAENVAISIIKHTRDCCQSVYASPKGEIIDALNKESIKSIMLDNYNMRNIRRVIKIFKPDIIHAHDFKASVLASLCAPLKTKIISHLHNNPMWIKKINIRTIVYLLASIRFCRILTVSKSVAKEYVFGSIVKNKIETIGNPFDMERIESMAKNENVKDNFDVIFVGRLTEQKNPVEFIEIIKRIKEFKSDIKAAMIGDGELRVELESIIKSNKLEKNIVLFGFMLNPYTIMNNSKIFCLPSKWEGFGLVLLEAASLGKPIVCTPVGGMVDIIDGDNGFLCDSTESFVDAINKLLTDDVLYNKASKKALETACRFDSKATGYYDKIKKVYEDNK